MRGRLSYYQGLNYVAGYSIIILEDADQCIRFLLTIIEKYFLKYICVDLMQVKRAFFVYERLIENFLPSIYKKFKKERISVDLFSTSWILTIFSLVSQFHPASEDLAEIWDIFIAKGWPGFFRVLIAVLKLKEEVILKMSYEEMMSLFCSIPKQGNLNSPSATDPNPAGFFKVSFKELIKEFDITESLIQHIECEHTLIEKEIETTWTLLRETEY